jgi:hypothetical protein
MIQKPKIKGKFGQKHVGKILDSNLVSGGHNTNAGN